MKAAGSTDRLYRGRIGDAGSSSIPPLRGRARRGLADRAPVLLPEPLTYAPHVIPVAAAEPPLLVPQGVLLLQMVLSFLPQEEEEEEGARRRGGVDRTCLADAALGVVAVVSTGRCEA